MRATVFSLVPAILLAATNLAAQSVGEMPSSLEQVQKRFSEEKKQTVSSATAFPNTWVGNWEGTLDIFNGKGKVQSVAMRMEIHPIDTSAEGRFAFGLIYGSKEQDWRPYELVPVAPDKGIWKVDEKNSIVMESFLYGPKLLCWFVVQNARVLCTYEKTDENTIVFEVISGPETPVSTTGNSKQGEEDIPEVKTYPCSVFQRAVLKKQG